ncbi:MAG TPA: fumarylacetoacetate hydrolase family protein [Candidatus Udaeobacter sp.]|nr:fumarylacetoacetate hydrolase family protein [Candidatus Udaeobacter sp.]
MKLASFAVSGRSSWGVVTNDGVIDMGRRLAGRFPSLRAALGEEALGEVSALARQTKPDHHLSAVTLLPPIPDPEKIICLGNNYRAHVLEAGGKIPDHPQVFIRLANTLVGHEGDLVVPRISSQLDYEVELAIVIGRAGRHVPVARALDHVAGYTCFHDASVRDIQVQHSLAAGKNFFATGPCGPWIVTRDEIPEPGQLSVTTRLNGRELQNGNTSDLIFDVPAVTAYVSTFTPLAPGDIIATGTPQGVGFTRKPPIWMKPGDVVEVEVEKIGVLRNRVVAESDAR